MGKESRKGKSVARVSAQDIEIYRLATEEGIKQDAIAERFGICEATVSRTMKRVRDYLKDIRDLQLDGAETPGAPPPATAAATGGSQGLQLIPRSGENILDQVADFAKVSQASASAGVIVGCAVDSILDGLTNQELSDEDGLLKTVNGFAAIGGFVFGSVRSVQKLQENKPQRATRRGE